jgi:hypothetical protein
MDGGSEAYLDLLECGLFLGAVGVDGQHAITAPDRHMLAVRTTITSHNQYSHGSVPDTFFPKKVGSDYVMSFYRPLVSCCRRVYLKATERPLAGSTSEASTRRVSLFTISSSPSSPATPKTSFAQQQDTWEMVEAPRPEVLGINLGANVCPCRVHR